LDRKDFIIVTGMSGSGKTSALRNLEDLGFFCVDNLPPALISKFAQLAESSGFERVAVAVNDSGDDFVQEIEKNLKDLETFDFHPHMVFFDAPDEVLVRRFSESYHRHPLAFREGSIIDAISKERSLLVEIRSRCGRIIDTGDMTPAKLKEEITRQYFNRYGGEHPISITVISFGFKYGIPRDLDLLFDARILPNPFYDPHLRPLDGQSREIQDFVFIDEESRIFLDKLLELVGFLIPRYISSGKSHLTIGIGCTGGHHRSVAVADRITGFLKGRNYRVSQDHRDICRQSEREPVRGESCREN